MPRFAIPVILALFFMSAFLLACAAEPTPTPVPTTTPTPPAWLAAAEGYADLADSVVTDTMADADFALDALRNTNNHNLTRIDEAKARAEVARSRQESYESELNDARRAINAPADVEELARSLGSTVYQVHYDTLETMDSTIAWGAFLVSAEGEKTDLKAWADMNREADTSESISRYEAALADFKAAIEQGKLETP